MEKNDIYDYATTLETQEDFNEFLKRLNQDYLENNSEWDNNTLKTFLDGLYGYSLDKKLNLSWKNLAELLLAAKVYE